MKMLVTTISAICLFTASANAYDVTLEQSLDFGTIVVIDNDSAGQLSIDRFGNVTISNNFRVIESGQPAVFSFTGLPSFSSPSIVISEVDSQMNPGQFSPETFTFTVTSFDPSARANGNGDALVSVGGTLTLSASGNNAFVDATYEANFRISVDL